MEEQDEEAENGGDENGHNEENDGESSHQSIASEEDTSAKRKSELDELFNKTKIKKNRRKKVDSEELNDMDGIITEIVNEMRSAYEVKKT